MSAAVNIDPLTAAPHAVRTFWTVQAMRAIAATLVVIGHSQTIVAQALAPGAFVRSAALPWGAGVDLFFVISGFVMVHASRPLFGTAGAARAFLGRRLVRIAPLYWSATAALLLLLAAASLKGGDPFPTVSAIAASFAFVPFDTWGNGRLMPVLDLGWTLNYELFFYLVFALGIALPRRRAIGVTLVILALLMLLGHWASPGSALFFWTRPILADFALGLVVGALSAARFRLPRRLRIVLAVAALAAFALDPAAVFDVPAGITVANGWPRVAAAGLPCAALLAAAVLGREPRQPRLLRPLGAIGDASYSLYLLHPFVLILLEKLMQKSRFAAALPPALLVLAAVAGALALALAVFRGFERPTTARLTAALKRRRLAAVPALARSA